MGANPEAEVQARIRDRVRDVDPPAAGHGERRDYDRQAAGGHVHRNSSFRIWLEPRPHSPELQRLSGWRACLLLRPSSKTRDEHLEADAAQLGSIHTQDESMDTRTFQLQFIEVERHDDDGLVT
jgi:hypothetical protein